MLQRMKMAAIRELSGMVTVSDGDMEIAQTIRYTHRNKPRMLKWASNDRESEILAQNNPLIVMLTVEGLEKKSESEYSVYSV